MTNPPQATVLAHGTIAPLGNFPCAVVQVPDTGEIVRVLSTRQFHKSLGRSSRPWRHESGHQLPCFTASDNIIPFINNDIKVVGISIAYPLRGGVALGYRAELLPVICSAYVSAYMAGALKPDQHHIAQHSAQVLQALAATGIVALVDEATGYQGQRAKDDLQRLVALYLRDTPLQWAKTFPNEYYLELYRVLGLKYQPRRGQHPAFIAVYTRRLVYDPIIPPCLWDELERRNPFATAHSRKTKLHAWLSSDFGQSRVTGQMTLVLGLLRASATWPQLCRLFDSAQPHGSQLSMALGSAAEATHARTA